MTLLIAPYGFAFSFLGFLEGNKVASLVTANGNTSIGVQMLLQTTKVIYMDGQALAANSFVEEPGWIVLASGPVGELDDYTA